MSKNKMQKPKHAKLAVCLVLTFVAGVLTSLLLRPALIPIRAHYIIQSMNRQEGGEYVRQCEQLLRLGYGTVSVLLQDGLASENPWVRHAVIEVLDILGWQALDNKIMATFTKIAADSNEQMIVRERAAKAYFNHTGRSPNAWEIFIDKGWLRFKISAEAAASAETMTTGGS